MEPEGALIVSVNDLLFIDANQYLYLYEMVSGKKLLVTLEDLRAHIFVTTQVVDEVNRNKVKITARFLDDWLKKSELSSISVPGHLLRPEDGRVERMHELQELRQKLKETKEERIEMTHHLLAQVSQSKDEVSKILASIFSQAVPPDEGELERARARRERGNPPGTQSDPLGDQLNWEQILSHCKDKPRLWIISKDSDYGAVHAGEMFLNASLFQELAQLYKAEPAVFCFDNIAEGLEHFVKTTGAKTENLPTPEETKQIKKEQESLPPIGWLTNYDDSAHIGMHFADALIMRDSLFKPALGSEGILGGGFEFPSSPPKKGR
jgi:hypothetical protein